MPSALVTVKLGAATSPVVGSMLVFNALATGFNWLTFTPSVSAVPLATLVTLLPPLFSPSLVRDTGEPAAPLAMFRPSVVSTLSPAVTLGVVSPVVVSSLAPAFKVVAVTLFNVMSSFSLTVTLSLSAEVVMLLPPLMPTRSPSFLLEVEVLPSASKVRPFSANSLSCA